MHSQLCSDPLPVVPEVRELFYPGVKPQFTGWIAYRGAVEVEHPFDGKTMMILGRVQVHSSLNHQAFHHCLIYFRPVF